MLQMNVPKFLWSEAVMTAAYLINRMPSRGLGMKTPCEMLLGANKFNVPPKVFGCTCFVRDYRATVGKLDPRSIRCIFVGYSTSQKGYKCWCPSQRRLFVSMDVNFREFELFYEKKVELNSQLEEDPPSTSSTRREGEKERIIITGEIPLERHEYHGTSENNSQEELRVQDEDQREHQGEHPPQEELRTPGQGELRVYQRRHRRQMSEVQQEQSQQHQPPPQHHVIPNAYVPGLSSNSSPVSPSA